MAGFVYNPSGQLIAPLFQAAGYIGQAHQGPSIMDVLNYNAKMKEQQGQQDAEAQRLQMAHQMMLERGQTPTQQAGAVTAKNRPISQSLSLQKKALRSSALSGVDLPQDQSDLFEKLENDPHTDLNTYEKIVGGAAANRKQSAAEAKTSAAEDQKQKALAQQEMLRQAALSQAKAKSEATEQEQQKHDRLAAVTKEMAELHSEMAQDGTANLINVHGANLAHMIGGIQPEQREKLVRYNQLQQERDRLSSGQASAVQPVQPQQQHQTAQPQAFTHTATGPNGHKIGRLPNGTWVDVQTGQPLQ